MARRRPLTVLRSTFAAAVIATVCLGTVAAAPSASAAPSPTSAPVSVVTFNVLAPIWAAPTFYPPTLDPALLGQQYRRSRITALLQSASTTTDVFCLQEVQTSEFNAFVAALGPRFDGAMSSNAPTYWSSWLTPGLPWQPNGTAIFVKRATVTTSTMRDIPLTSDGNHAVLFDGTVRATGRRLRIGSVHLDSDRGNNRVAEANALVAAMPLARGSLDIVCGDLNEDSVTGSVSGLLGHEGYTDVLASLGNRESTHPWSSTYNKAGMWGIIDHIVVRGAAPVAGDVLDGGVWSIADEVARIAQNLRNVGSDHFPVTGTVGS